MGVEPTAACLCSQPPVLKTGTPTGTHSPPLESIAACLQCVNGGTLTTQSFA